MSGRKYVEVSEEAHGRLSRFGNLGETYSQAIKRALNQAEAAHG